MSWFDVVATPDGRSFAVSNSRAGSLPSFGRLAAVQDLGSSRWDVLTPLGLVSRIINLTVFRGAWQVRVAPWEGRRGRQWKVQAPTEADSERLCEDFCQLIKGGRWDPDQTPPPTTTM